VADATVMLRHLPPQYEAAEDVIGGMVAPLEQARLTAADMRDASTVAGADGKWLTLLARGYGVVRATDEGDAALRARLRNVENKLTRQAILDAVNALLAPYSGQPAQMAEWFEEDGAFWLDFDFLDDQRLLGEWHTFYLFAPLVGTAAWGDLFLDDAFLDAEYLGAGPDHPIYASITAEVERLRAAGVRWLLITE